MVVLYSLIWNSKHKFKDGRFSLMELALFAAILSLIISLSLTPLVRILSLKFNVLAAVNHRTVHNEKTPKLGGISIFVAFLVGTFIFFSGEVPQSDYYLGLVLGACVVAFTGFIDDTFHLSCYSKLVAETIAASIAVYFGIHFNSLSLPFLTHMELGWLTIALSILWIISITNAINLLDGLDGLASGFSIICGIFIIIIAGITKDLTVAAIAFILVTSTLGFLRYNFYPAKIFMGDTGSLFLGFILSCLSLKVFTFEFSGTHLGAMLVAFAFPITDTTLAVIRRIASGEHPFTADKKHIHHRLMDLGLNQSTAVLTIYAATIIFSISAFILISIEIKQAILFIIAIFTIFTVALFQLGCFDFLIIKIFKESLPTKRKQ